MFTSPGYSQSLIPGLTSDDSGEVEELTPQSPEAIRDMVARLSDQEVRLLLLERLDAVVEAEASNTSDGSEMGVFEFFSFWGDGVRESLTIAVTRLPGLIPGQFQSFKNFVDKRGSSGTWRTIAIFLLAIATGFIVEWMVRQLTKRWHSYVDAPQKSDNFKASFKILSLRLLLDLAGLIAFAIVTFTILSTQLAPQDEQIFDAILFNIIFFPRFMMAWIRFLLAPNRSELRLVHTDDQTAKFIYKHTLGLFVLMGLGTTVVMFNGMNGIPPGALRIGFWLSLVVYAYLIYISWNAREGMTQMLLGKNQDVTPIETRIAYFYPYFMIGLTVLVYLVVELIVSLGKFELLMNRPHMLTLLIFLFVPAMDTLIRSVVTYLSPPMQGEGIVAERAYHSTKRCYLRMGRVLVFGLIVILLMNAWQINLNTMASNAVGAGFAASLVKLLMILSVGYMIWEIVTLVINRKLAAESTAAGIDLNSEEPGGGEGGGTGASRLSTILPLLRFTLQTIVIIMTVLIGLSNIGINVTPLLAGAGVVGIAVGFGAQKLVADVVSGIFFLVDDAFRAGEYISVDGTVGTIEKISLRSMQLRHHRGAVHTIPYGEIPKLTNYSRDWVLMKLKFTVPFDTDLKKVKKLFKQIGSDVIELPHFKDDFLQPFKSQGVLQVNDVGLVIGGKFMAKPGTQFMMRKELYQRIQNAFEANGIQFARKEVRVKLDGEHHEPLDAEKQQAIGAAASEAVEDQQDTTAPQSDQR